MVPDNFANYFLASAGAGAALIGLLFVAISIRPDSTVGDNAHPVRRGVASAAFTALVNAFFVSLTALIPLSNVGGVALIVGVIDVVITLNLARDLLRAGWHAHGRWVTEARVGTMLVGSVTFYAYEAYIGARLLADPRSPALALGLSEILLGVYAVGLVRAWELLGGPGGVARWLNPLRDIEDVQSQGVERSISATPVVAAATEVAPAVDASATVRAVSDEHAPPAG